MYITFESIFARYGLSIVKNLILLVSFMLLHHACMHNAALFLIIEYENLSYGLCCLRQR